MKTTWKIQEIRQNQKSGGIERDATGMVSERVSAHSAKAGGENPGAADRARAAGFEVADV